MYLLVQKQCIDFRTTGGMFLERHGTCCFKLYLLYYLLNYNKNIIRVNIKLLYITKSTI